MSRRRQVEPTSMADAYAGMRGDYNIAKQTRFRSRLTGVAFTGSGADYHMRSDPGNMRAIEQAREFARNDPIVGQGVRRLVNNVLQDGPKVDPTTGSDDLDALLRARWDEWGNDADQCDTAGEQTLHGFAWLGLRNTVIDGDMFVSPLQDGTMEAIEAHRCRTPTGTKRNVVNGILLDPTSRRRLQYWFTKEDVSPLRPVRLVSEITPIDARDSDGNRNVFHLYDPMRFSQTRGITALAPIADKVGMYDDLDFAQLVKAQVSSCWTIFHERELEYAGGDPGAVGSQTTETLADGTPRTTETLSPGMEVFGAPGDKMHGFSPNVPNPEFFTHSKLILGVIAVNLDLPLAVLLLDPSETNFSGWRGAMDQAREGFKRIRRWMQERFYRPTYLWQVRRWIATDAKIRSLVNGSGVNPFAHAWSPPFWQYIEPLKDANADRVVVDNNLNSRRGVLTRRGIDIEKIDHETVTDNDRLIRMAIEAAGSINEDFQDAAVDWRELIGQDSGAAITINEASNEPNNTGGSA